jgi:hypothetical protein
MPTTVFNVPAYVGNRLFGANMSLETKDGRHLIANTWFSIERGIYLLEFGIRSEVNIFLEKDSVVVSGDPIQTGIHRIDCG